MRVWVTGGRGFVGARLASRLRSEGHVPFGDDHEVDVTDSARVADLIVREVPGAIIHLAGVSFVPDASRDPMLAWRVNYAGTRIVLDAVARHAPATRILVVTSGLVYGPCPDLETPLDESAALAPKGPYASSKAAADMLAGRYAANGLDIVRLRPFNHTGAGRPEHFVESSFARQIAEIEAGRREAVIRVGNLDAVRDFLHVDDVIGAYVRLLGPRGPAGPYNVSSGQPLTIRTVLETLLAASDADPRIEVDPDLWREADASFGTSTRLQHAAGWQPRVAFADTMAELLMDWRSRLA